MNWRVVFSIVRKDMVDAIKNFYLLFVMIMPIGMSLMFQLVFPNEQEMSQMTIVIYDPENSRLSSMMQAYQGVEVVAAISAEEVANRVNGDKAITGGLVIATGFDAALDAGEKPQVRAFINPDASSIQQAAFRGIVTDQSWLLVRQEFPIELIWGDEQSAGSSDATGPDMPFNLDIYMLLVVLMMGLAMVGSFVVPSLMVEEKEKHTLEALLVAPGGPTEVTTGKAIVGMVYSLLVAGILLAMNNGFAGNWPFTLIAIGLGSLFIVGVGLLMGTAFKVMSQVNIVSSIVMLVMIIPSWVGIFTLPEPLGTLVNFIPTFYVSKITSLALTSKATLANTGSSLVLLSLSVVIVYAAVVWMLRRERK
jgi:ABC-2 type transport system permease protein